jgi:aryl-alcohol dehydrogenase-like predicted oxidoreductase
VESEIVPACRRYGVGVVPYFPLASGLLTGKYTRGEDFPEGSRLGASSYFASVATDANFDRVERLTAAAEGRGHTILELAICWLLAQDGVSSVLTGATKAEQVVANVAAASWRMDADDLAAVDEALAGG